MAHPKIISNGLTLNFTPGDGSGDQILTISSIGEVKAIPAITTPLSASLLDGRIFVGNGSNIATGVTPSGDITLTNTGVFGIATGVIVNSDINASAAIAYSKLNLTGGIVNADVNASAAIAYSKLNLVGSIVNADVNAAAAIARTKFANGTANRVVVNNASGVMTDNAAITANRAIISDANGLPTHATTTSTEIGFVNGVTSAIQTQLNTKIVAKDTSSTLQSPGAGQQGFVISWDNTNSRFDLTSVSASGVPNGGTTNQILRKIDNVDQNTEWHTLVFGDLTDVSGTTVTEINLLNGMTVGSTELNTLTGIGGNVQTQLDNKLSGSLATDNLYVGVAGVATATTNLPNATTIGGAAIYRAGGSDVALADGGTGASLADPGADRILFWDDSAGQVTWLTAGSGLTITGTTLDVTSTVTPAALTRVDDTNVTLTLGGTPATALLQATSLTLGWTGTLAESRGGTGAASFPGWRLASGGTLTGANTITGTTTNIIKYAFASLGTTQTDGAGLWLQNATAAAAGSQQISPSIVFEGNGWKTNATAASQSFKVNNHLLPVQGTANPTSIFKWQYSINNVAYSDFLTWSGPDAARFDFNGNLYTNGDIHKSTSGTLNIGILGNIYQTIGTDGQITWTLNTTPTFPVAYHKITQTLTNSNTTNTFKYYSATPTYNLTGTSALTITGFEYAPTTLTSTVGLINKAWYHNSGYIQWDSVLSPAQITSNQNDYNPTGLNNGGAPAGATILRVNTDASRNITSIVGGVSGRLLIISNVGSFDVVLKDDDGSTGTAANRFDFNVDITIPPSAAQVVWYDGTTSRWRANNIISAVNQATSGTYTPTLTNVTNVAASTAYVTGYYRVGNSVTVYGKVDIDVTLAASTATELGISLPITSNLANEEDLAGTAVSDSIASLTARIKADATNDRASVVFKAISLTNDSYAFQFSYQVK